MLLLLLRSCCNCFLIVGIIEVATAVTNAVAVVGATVAAVCKNKDILYNKYTVIL